MTGELDGAEGEGDAEGDGIAEADAEVAGIAFDVVPGSAGVDEHAVSASRPATATATQRVFLGTFSPIRQTAQQDLIELLPTRVRSTDDTHRHALVENPKDRLWTTSVTDSILEGCRWRYRSDLPGVPANLNRPNDGRSAMTLDGTLAIRPADSPPGRWSEVGAEVLLARGRAGPPYYEGINKALALML